MFSHFPIFSGQQRVTPYADAATWGVVGWAPAALDILFTAMNDTVEYELDQLAPLVSQVRLQSSLEGASESMDDASPANVQALVACAQRTIADRKADIDALVAELRTPLVDRNVLGYPQPGAPPRPDSISEFHLPTIKLTAAVADVKGAASSAAVWRLGGAAAGALMGGAVAGPVGALIGGALGYFGGNEATKEG